MAAPPAGRFAGSPKPQPGLRQFADLPPFSGNHRCGHQGLAPTSRHQPPCRRGQSAWATWASGPCRFKEALHQRRPFTAAGGEADSIIQCPPPYGSQQPCTPPETNSRVLPECAPFSRTSPTPGRSIWRCPWQIMTNNVPSKAGCFFRNARHPARPLHSAACEEKRRRNHCRRKPPFESLKATPVRLSSPATFVSADHAWQSGGVAEVADEHHERCGIRFDAERGPCGLAAHPKWDLDHNGPPSTDAASLLEPGHPSRPAHRCAVRSRAARRRSSSVVSSSRRRVSISPVSVPPRPARRCPRPTRRLRRRWPPRGRPGCAAAAAA